MSRKPIIINLIQETDWLQYAQYEDDECSLLKRQIADDTLDKSYKMVKVCKLISGEIKLVVPKDIRWKVVRY